MQKMTKDIMTTEVVTTTSCATVESIITGDVVSVMTITLVSEIANIIAERTGLR